MTTRAQPVRGQAMVELAIGILLLVTVLTVGIHFAEVGYITLKVSEAANFALFDATGRRVHDIEGGNWGLYRTSGTGAIDKSQTVAQNRYKDFNGLASETGSTTLTQVFTKATGMTVTCNRSTALPNINTGVSGNANANGAYGKASNENAGVTCWAEADLDTYKMPKNYENGAGGIFNTKNWARTSAIHVCSAGRGSSCGGKAFIMSLDDWGLQGGAQSGNHEGDNCGSGSGAPVSGGCQNQGYFQLVQGTFPGVGGAASALAVDSAGFSPTSESTFWMNFEGEDSPTGKPFQSALPADEHGNLNWDTTPFSTPSNYQSAYNGSHSNPCFLGRPCT